MQASRFEKLLEPVYADLVRYSRAMAGSEQDGDDLLQEALIRAWKGFGKLKESTSFKPWILKIISNTSHTWHRKQWFKRYVSLDHAENLVFTETLPFEEKELVRMALRGLTRKLREAVVLYEVLELSMQEIAEIQRCSIPAVKSRVARGRQKLRERYSQLAEKEESHEGQVVSAN